MNIWTEVVFISNFANKKLDVRYQKLISVLDFNSYPIPDDMEFIEKYFSKYPEEKMIKWFKQICLAEAISWFFLFTAMTWIRIDPEGVFPIVYISTIGSIHGFFFTLYLLFLPSIRKIYTWDDEDSVFALISAFFPFATIWIDKSLARKDREQ